VRDRWGDGEEEKRKEKKRKEKKREAHPLTSVRWVGGLVD
jgi:hypothetical protein